MAIKSIEIAVLDKESDTLVFNKGILILSPSLYWFVKEKMKIPLSQAKKIAPSMFEGIIPSGKYSYFVEKVGEEYWFFAYQDSQILNKLSELGIKPSQVSKVYLAQLALKDIQEPIDAGNKILINEQGTIIALPKSMFPIEAKKLSQIQFDLPKRSLPLRSYTNLVISEEILYRFSILVFITIVAYAVETFIHKKNFATLSAKEQAIMSQYHLPPTTIQIKNIIASLEKIQKQQLAIRDDLDAILRIPLAPTEFFQSLSIGKDIRFEIALIDPKRAELIKNYLVKKIHVLDMQLRGKILSVKCSL
ncbi:hypothetical protein NitYY0826_P08 (plasmid) [Nitratiruptor sp. YY08-26]|uniref:hypothetical protein n=1 Tax=unclassified Nitratiruptor TaxID=2624044 RepID=UPI0018EB114D|nr:MULTISPECIES: hypothetical protein [unclassified Nitratiruptor]BCD63167.1 hypothetical protein NitYY0813_P08 [Nitratiruptor sp. YY08-13]BCD67103.1 hypothetical protein NitYY0826_P08 [Nitratiruptor sp. YY08-26]